MQAVADLIYPPQCAACDERLDRKNGLCGSCWRDMKIISGLVCDLCGAPLPGVHEPSGAMHGARCDDCIAIARPWSRGRSAMLYHGTGRRLVLSLKHGDRLDLAEVCARWLATAAAPLLLDGTVIVPVPIHTLRLLRRRHNQAVLLAQALAGKTGFRAEFNALKRLRSTFSQDGLGLKERFENVGGSIVPGARANSALKDRPVLIFDDVFTSGATFAAATEACISAGASQVSVLALARVVKDA